jgi:hypothetical protein
MRKCEKCSIFPNPLCQAPGTKFKNRSEDIAAHGHGACCAKLSMPHDGPAWLPPVPKIRGKKLWPSPTAKRNELALSGSGCAQPWARTTSHLATSNVHLHSIGLQISWDFKPLKSPQGKKYTSHKVVKRLKMSPSPTPTLHPKLNRLAHRQATQKPPKSPRFRIYQVSDSSILSDMVEFSNPFSHEKTHRWDKWI